MDVGAMIRTVMRHPEHRSMGMIASHLGVVRETSLSGNRVSGIEVRFDRKALDGIVRETLAREGIYEVLVEAADGRLDVGDAIMAVVVGGDVRERVFPALIDAVDRIKTEASRKMELF